MSDLYPAAPAVTETAGATYRTAIERVGSETEYLHFGEGYWSARAVFHDAERIAGQEVVWACVTYKNEVRLLRSTDYFETFEVVSSLPLDHPLQPRSNFLYRDKFLHSYVLGTPSPLIIRNGTDQWEKLRWEFNCEFNTLQHMWNVSEDARRDALIFTEYSWVPPGVPCDEDCGCGEQCCDPALAHGIFTSTDPLRTCWDKHNLTPPGECFRHIHGFHCHPGGNGVLLLSLGDPWHKSSGNDPRRIGIRPGLWLFAPSIDPERPAPISMDHIPPAPDAGSWNGPTHVTWWPDGSAFIASDNLDDEGWFGTLGPDWSDPASLRLKVLFRMSDTVPKFARGTPWGAIAVAGSYETYCSVYLESEGQNALFRYTPAEGARMLYNSWESRDPSLCVWLSGGRNNLLPSFSRYIFAGGSDTRVLRIRTRSG